MTWLLANWRLVLVSLLLAAAYATGWLHNDRSWTLQVQADQLAQSTATAAAMVTQRQQTEAIRADYLRSKADADAKIAELESRVAAGTGRLRVAARCVPATGAGAGRADPGAPELDAAARPAYFALRRGLADQYALLQLCRAELLKRSASSPP